MLTGLHLTGIAAFVASYIAAVGLEINRRILVNDENLSSDAYFQVINAVRSFYIYFTLKKKKKVTKVSTKINQNVETVHLIKTVQCCSM